MFFARPRPLPGFAPLRLAALLAALPLVGLACAPCGFTVPDGPTPPPAARGGPDAKKAEPAGVVLASYTAADPELPPPTPADAPTLLPAPAPAVHPAAHPAVSRVAILSLDGVLRLADEQNTQISEARLRVDEAVAAAEVACASRLPDCLRDEQFRSTTAPARVWQQRVEYARTRYEVLQDAGNTYVDWVTARHGARIEAELQADEQKLLKKAQALAKDEPSAEALVEMIRTGMSGRDQAITRLRQQAEAAATKLASLLGLDGALLQPADDAAALAGTGEGPAPAALVDADQPAEALAEQAEANGPGARELRGLESAVVKALEKAQRLERMCSLTGSCSVCGRLRIAHLKLDEVHVAQEDQRRKLRAGALEARSAILSGREQMAQAREVIRHARESQRLGNVHLEDKVRRESVSDVEQSIRSLQAGRLGYIQVVSDYDKAEVRLLLLLGLGGDCPPHAPAGPHVAAVP
jgi:outer membrane protein TolC